MPQPESSCSESSAPSSLPSTPLFSAASSARRGGFSDQTSSLPLSSPSSVSFHTTAAPESNGQSSSGLGSAYPFRASPALSISIPVNANLTPPIAFSSVTRGATTIAAHSPSLPPVPRLPLSASRPATPATATATPRTFDINKNTNPVPPSPPVTKIVSAQCTPRNTPPQSYPAPYLPARFFVSAPPASSAPHRFTPHSSPPPTWCLPMSPSAGALPQMSRPPVVLRSMSPLSYQPSFPPRPSFASYPVQTQHQTPLQTQLQTQPQSPPISFFSQRFLPIRPSSSFFVWPPRNFFPQQAASAFLYTAQSRPARPTPATVWPQFSLQQNNFRTPSAPAFPSHPLWIRTLHNVGRTLLFR